MEIINAVSKSIRTETFLIKKDGKTYRLITSFDGSDLEPIGSEVQNWLGEEVSDPALFDEIETFVNSIPYEKLQSFFSE